MGNNFKSHKLVSFLLSSVLALFLIHYSSFNHPALATCYCANPQADQCKCSAAPPGDAIYNGVQDGVAVKCTSQAEANSTFERKNPICGFASETIPYCAHATSDQTDVTCWGTEFNSGNSNVPPETGGELISWNKPVDFNGFHADNVAKLLTCESGLFCCGRSDIQCEQGGLPQGGSCSPQNGPGNPLVCQATTPPPGSGGTPNIQCVPPTDPEFHSLRPYPGSVCIASAPTVTACGNDLIVEKEYQLTPAQAKNCTPNPDGKTRNCNFEFNDSVNVKISVPEAELPIVGNTELVKNSTNPTGQLDNPQRTNEYVSWYLNGINYRAEEDPNDPRNADGLKNLLSFAGPLRKLLPKSIVQKEQIDQIAKINTERHDQITVCAHKEFLNLFGQYLPHECYKGDGSPAIAKKYRLSDWNGSLSAFNTIIDIALPLLANIVPSIGTDALRDAIGSPWNDRKPPLESGTDPNGELFTDLTYRKAYQEWTGKTCAIVTIPIINIKQLFCVDNPAVPNEYANLFPYVQPSSTEDLPGKVYANVGSGSGGGSGGGGGLSGDYGSEIDQFMAAGASYYIAWQYSGNRGNPLANDQFSFYQGSPACATLQAKAAQYPGKIGVNIYSLSNISDAEIREHLTYVKNECGTSIVRFWGFDSPDTIMKVLNAGRDVGGLQFIIALADFGVVGGDPTGWYSSGYQATYLPHAIQVADAINANGLGGVVYALELVNEPHCFGQTSCIAPYAQWAGVVSGTLSGKGIRVGIGQKASEDTTRGDSPGVGTPPDFSLSNNFGSIGTTSAHYYDGAQKAKAFQALGLAQGLGKPFYIGEAGFGSGSSGTAQGAGVSNVRFAPTNRENLIYVPHMEETTGLSSLLQTTFAAKGVDTSSGPAIDTEVLNQPYCDINNARTNPGDDLLGERSTPVQGSLNYTYSTSCEFGTPTLDTTCYAECIDEGTNPTECNSRCLKTNSCTRTANVALGVFTKTPKVDELWYRTVFGDQSIFKRIFPKALSDETHVLDIPGVTNASYESTGTRTLAGNPANQRPGTSAQIFIPHLGGIYEYFLKGIQTALRPKDLGSTLIPGITTPPKDVNCNKSAPDVNLAGILSKDDYEGLALQWVGGSPGNHAKDCYNDVVAKATAAGVNPALALWIWVHESDASNYNVSVEDFGVHFGQPQGFNDQIAGFLSRAKTYNTSHFTCNGTGVTNDLQAFAYIYKSGKCSADGEGAEEFWQALNNQFNWVAPGCTLPESPTDVSCN